MEAKPLKWHDRQEKVWVVTQPPIEGSKIIGVAVSDTVGGDLPGVDKSKPFMSSATLLHRPSLAPVYGGPTLLEALWNEMDRLMESLMTGIENAEDVCGKVRCGDRSIGEDRCDHPDNGDKYRAQELAWVLAIVTNAYDPDVNKIRAEAVNRWNAAQEEQ